MSVINLWPEDLGAAIPDTPGLILRQQAAGLSERTRDLVEGEVKTVTKDGQLIHRFYARAPLLDYRVQLFDVRHGIEPYPASVIWPKGFATPREAGSPEVLIEVLREVFNHATTGRTIRQLEAYARDQGLPFLLVEDKEVVGEARTLALAMRKANERLSEGSEIIIFHNGTEVGSVRNKNGELSSQVHARISIH